MTNDTITTNRMLTRFQWIVRFMGFSFIVFFMFALLGALFHVDRWLMQSELGTLIMHLGRWGDPHGGGEHYEIMISSIYIVWGFSLIIAAKEPLKHKLFFDFSAWTNIAHFGSMLIMALCMHQEHIHLAGDVALGWGILLIYLISWRSVREQFV